MGDADVQNAVAEMLHVDKVVVFSKTQCPYCSQTKSLLETLGCAFKAYELDEMENGPRIQDYLGQLTGARTVPRVFIKGRCIGGASDTKKLHDEGVLRSMLH